MLSAKEAPRSSLSSDENPPLETSLPGPSPAAVSGVSQGHPLPPRSQTKSEPRIPSLKTPCPETRCEGPRGPRAGVAPPPRFRRHPGPHRARRPGTHLTSGSFSGRAGSSRHRHGQQQQALRSQRRSPMGSEARRRDPGAGRAMAAGARGRGRGRPRRHGPGRAHHAAAGRGDARRAFAAGAFPSLF